MQSQHLLWREQSFPPRCSLPCKPSIEFSAYCPDAETPIWCKTSSLHFRTPGASCHPQEGRFACGSLELCINITHFGHTVKNLNSSKLRADCKLLQISSCRFQIICLNGSGKYQIFIIMTNVLPKEIGGKLSKLFYREMQVALSHSTDPCPPCPSLSNSPQPAISKLWGKLCYEIGPFPQTVSSETPEPRVSLTVVLCCQSSVVSKMTPKCQNQMNNAEFEL